MTFLAALNNLTFKPQGDLRDQYDAFVSASKNLDNANMNLDVESRPDAGRRRRLRRKLDQPDRRHSKPGSQAAQHRPHE